MDGVLPSDATKFVHEVINHIYSYYPKSVLFELHIKYSACFSVISLTGSETIGMHTHSEDSAGMFFSDLYSSPMTV